MNRDELLAAVAVGLASFVANTAVAVAREGLARKKAAAVFELRIDAMTDQAHPLWSDWERQVSS